MRCVGIDVSKAQADVSVRDQEGQIVEHLTIANAPDGFQGLAKHLKPRGSPRLPSSWIR